MPTLPEPKPMFVEPLKSYLELGRNVAVLMTLWALTIAAWDYVPAFFPAWLKLAGLGSLTAVLAFLTIGVLIAAHESFNEWRESRWQMQAMSGKLLAIGGVGLFLSALLGVVLVVVGAISLGVAL